LSTPTVVQSLDVKNDPFRPREDNEELLGSEVPYLNAIDALMYLANNTRPDITLSVNLLAKYNFSPTWRHWNEIKHIFHYLRGNMNMGLFYSNDASHKLVGYADAGFLYDPHKGRSLTSYLFTCGNTVISWRSTKKILVATSSKHAEILAIHKANHECVWLRLMTQHIRGICGLSSSKGTLTILYEDNIAYIAQLKGDTSKEIGQNTSHQNSSSHMTLKSMATLMFNKSARFSTNSLER
jgi:hypothetical protein